MGLSWKAKTQQKNSTSGATSEHKVDRGNEKSEAVMGELL
jgi:hypothetical protein